MVNPTEVRRGATPPYVSTSEALQEVVDAITTEGIFCFDVETRGNIYNHPEVIQEVEREWLVKQAELKATNLSVIARSKQVVEAAWTKSLALDPLRNEVTWIGISVRGQSWAIPMTHPHGEMLTPPERGDGTTVPPLGMRAVLASGKESGAKAKYFVPGTFLPPPTQLSPSEVWGALAPLFLDPSIPKVGHNIKFDARSIAKSIGGMPEGSLIDTMILMHITSENLMSYSLEKVIGNQFEQWSPYYRDGKLGADMENISFSKACYYVHLDARWTWMLYSQLVRKITKHPSLTKAMYGDISVTGPIARMEQAGVMVNKREMAKLGKSLTLEMNNLLLLMSPHVPLGFNPDSNMHKRQLLFSGKKEGGLGLKATKFTSGGAKSAPLPSVDSDVLESFRGKHEVVDHLLGWQELTKMKSTYVEGLLPMLHSGRLHPQFHLHRTATGRLSSSGPNLQNIPRDGKVRSLFTAEPGNSLFDADYDQVELRILAMFSGDKNLTKIFLSGIDVHSGTASLILGKHVDDVTSEERQVYGKTPNFLMGFGGGAKRLVESTNGVITLDRAKDVIKEYNRAYQGMTDWKLQVVVRGRRLGYVETMGGRRRRLPDLNLIGNDEKIRILRMTAERQAVNAIVQGTAAEMCKQAIVNVDKLIRNTNVKLLIQVHDELVLSVPTEELGEWEPKIIHAMGDGSIIRGIPIKVSAGYAGSWYDAKG